MSLGSYDEICELDGIYTLSNVENITSKENIGFYRNDSLIF